MSETTSPADLRQMLAWFRALPASHTATETMLADAIRSTEWLLADSIHTSAPAPAPKPVIVSPPVEPVPVAVPPVEPPAKKKRTYSPEALERLRAHAAAMRARKDLTTNPVREAPPPAFNAAAMTGFVKAVITAMEPTPAPPPPAPPKITRTEALARVSNAAAGTSWGPPVLADFEAVGTWAGPRGLPFTSWDDLPAIYRKREALGLPRFARAFKRVGGR